MQISLLKKLLRQISPRALRREAKESEATSEQRQVDDMDGMNAPTSEITEQTVAQTPLSAEETVDRDLNELRESFPELSEINSVTELKNPTRYAALRDLGLSAEEAYLATNGRVAKGDNRSHLTSGVPASARIPASGMSRAQMEDARELFRDLSDTEIQKLYQKVTK